MALHTEVPQVGHPAAAQCRVEVLISRAIEANDNDRARRRTVGPSVDSKRFRGAGGHVSGVLARDSVTRFSLAEAGLEDVKRLVQFGL